MAFDEVSSPVLAKQFTNSNFDAEEYVKKLVGKCDLYRALVEQKVSLTI